MENKQPKIIPKPSFWDEVEKGIFCLPYVVSNEHSFKVEHRLYRTDKKTVKLYQKLIEKVLVLTQSDEITSIQALYLHPFWKNCQRVGKEEIKYSKS
jgi:hypothetical protein